MKSAIMAWVAGICLTQIPALADYSEGFETAPAGADLQVGGLPGWSLVGNIQPEGMAVVDPQAGCPEGQGLLIRQANIFAEHRADAPLWTAAEGPVTFSVDFRRTAPLLLNLVLSRDAVAGFWIVVEKSSVQVSTGGDNAFQATTQSFPVQVLDGMWYTLQIREIDLDEQSDSSQPVTGKLYLYEAGNPRHILLDGVTITAAGEQKRSFSSINRVTFRRFGGALGVAELQIDNVSLKGAKQ